MEHSNLIYQKLEAFIRKFYTNELIRGTAFFIGLGLLYFLFTLFVEYFLWLKPIARTFLFWSFVVIEIFLLFRFILFPVFKLFKLQKGIGYKEASAIIGNHFEVVSDKLTNFLQLADADRNENSSELIVASIEQKANALQPIAFGNAINFNSNRKYLPLAIVPVLFFLFFYLSGNNAIISQSFNRVVHYNASFSPPAPFQFVVVNANLQTEQNKDFMIKIKTVGSVVPENVQIFIDDESYFMESITSGEFQFRVTKPAVDVLFHVEGNDVSSPDYTLMIIAVPSIANFEMQLNFPAYINRKPESIKGTGNAVLPEGTRVTWKLATQATQKVTWSNETESFLFLKSEDNFSLSKRISQSTDYQIGTSNIKVANYEKLNYQLTVIKDQYPVIIVSNVPDSLKTENKFVLGQISDDYGLSRLQIVYYERNRPETMQRGSIAIKIGTVDQFVYSFPGALPVKQGVLYEYYFEVFDNDVLHRFKSSKSATFSNRVASDEEKEDQFLQQQNENINSLQKSLKKQDKQISDIEKLQKLGKEKEKFEFKEQQEVKDFIKRQKQQDDLMKEFADKMKNNLDKFKSEKDDAAKQELQKRLENANKDLEENQKLLDQLKELNDKIKNEELLSKLEKFKQNSKNQVKNLQQLVELTKKYYVEKKAEQIADKLDKLSQKQEQLADNIKENSVETQADVKKSFEKIVDELKELSKDNNELKTPFALADDAVNKKNIEEDLKNALEELHKENKAKAKPKQKNAAKSMKAMAMKMTQSREAGEQEQMEEDVKMLRQVVDNLLAFSLSEEAVMTQFRNLKNGSPSFNKNIKIQQNLKLQFKHVDDSLFAMSLRNPKIAEAVTGEIGNVQYNIDKALESFSDSSFGKGVSHQQYAVAAANKLGDLLSDYLNNMQLSLSGMGSGKPKPGSGSGMQLADIIKKQEGLANKMKDGLDKGAKPSDGDKGKKEGGAQPGQGTEPGGLDGEGDAQAIMEIYKEQQQLREALEKELNKQGLGGSGQNALDQMKQIEKQLLNKGFKDETLKIILNLKQELLKLDTAVQQQGQENKRQAASNKKEFNNNSKPLPDALLDYLKSIEILNRQSLPLRTNFNRKVQEYFNKK